LIRISSILILFLFSCLTVNTVYAQCHSTESAGVKSRLVNKAVAKELTALMIEEDEDEILHSGHKRAIQTYAYFLDAAPAMLGPIRNTDDLINGSQGRKAFLLFLRLRI
jgi:hypothetical protein